MPTYSALETFPVKLEVEQLIESRYPRGERPLSWDGRTEGVDSVRTTDGRLLRLFSDGGQSPPKKGWVIMVEGGSSERGYRWTLYGLPSRAVL